MTLFLHGFTGSPRSGDALRDELDKRRPNDGWNAPALFGHGADLAGVRTFDDEVSRLLSQAKASVLVGYSLGARLALALVLREPKRFQRVIFVALNPGIEEDTARETRLQSDAALAASLLTDGLEAFVDRWERLPLFREEALSPDKRASRRRIRLGHSAAGLARSLEVLGLGRMPSYWDRLADLPDNTHIVVGACDTKYVALARRVQAKAPWVEVHVVPDAGHDVLLHSPGVVAELAA